jgi:hypothetical protein
VILKPGRSPISFGMPNMMMKYCSAPLPVGEDSQDYAALAREIRKAVAPKIIFDQIRVADILHFAWEEARYRKQRVALPHATRLKAAVVLLIPWTKNFEMKTTQIALDYLVWSRASERAACGSLELTMPL